MGWDEERTRQADGHKDAKGQATATAQEVQREGLQGVTKEEVGRVGGQWQDSH